MNRTLTPVPQTPVNVGTGYALLMTTFNANRLQHAISRIEADDQRSADTHLFALEAKMHISAQLA